MLVSIFIISGCSNNVDNRISKSSTKAGQHELTYDQLKTKLSSDDNFILYIGRPDCGDCAEFEPIASAYLKDNPEVSIYYLNVKKFRDDSRKEDATKEEKEFFENIKTELNFSWTPTLHHIKNGEILDTYTYLNKEYYELDEDSKEAKDKKLAFIEEFNVWMKEQFK